MKRFKGHYPIGVTRTCKGSGMSVAQQRNVLRAIGIKNIWRLGVDDLDDVMVGFHRKDENGDPDPTVLVTPIPAVVGNDRRDIFETLARLGQSLYDLELNRFINLEGAEDIIMYERRCHKQRADYARNKVRSPGRKSALNDDEWKKAAQDWCNPDKADINNDDIAESYGVTAPAFNARFGPRKRCLATGKVQD